MQTVKQLRNEITRITQQRDELYRTFEGLRRNYIASENFINSLWVHTETDDEKNYSILRTEMNALAANIQRHSQEHSEFFEAMKKMDVIIFD